MVAALVVIVVYALLPYEVAIGDFALKPISLAQLFPKTENPADTPQQPKTKATVKHHTFLFIGDSMVEGLSRRLADYAQENGHKLYTVIWYSSTTEKWASTHTLEHFIRKYRPTYLFICLGSNELFLKDLEARETFIRTIIEKCKNHPYVWIGPAAWNGDKGIISLIERHAGAGHFFNSRNLKLERGSDHYHPTWAAAALWMDKAVAYLNSPKAAEPLNLKRPKASHKATLTTLLQPHFEGY